MKMRTLSATKKLARKEFQRSFMLGILPLLEKVLLKRKKKQNKQVWGDRPNPINKKELHLNQSEHKFLKPFKKES